MIDAILMLGGSKFSAPASDPYFFTIMSVLLGFLIFSRMINWWNDAISSTNLINQLCVYSESIFESSHGYMVESSHGYRLPNVTAFWS